MLDSDTKILGVLGNPIKHSLSPVIQNHFLRTNKIDASYFTFEIGKNELSAVIKGAEAMGFLGFNVTMPFKQDIIRFLDDIDHTAEIMDSVNTIIFDQKRKKSKGYNTDGDGILLAIKDSGIDLKDKNVLVLGAGGTARSAVFSIIKNPVKKIYIYNRTQKKAEEVLKRFEKYADNKIRVLKSLELNKKSVKDIDLIINCTSLGMKGNDRKMPVPKDWDLCGKTVMEMVYNPINTDLVDKSQKDGARIIKGLDVLINQAAHSFYLWFNVLPERKSIRKVLFDEYK